MLYYPTVPPCSPDISIIPPYLFFFRWSAIVIFSSLGVINSSMFHGIKPVVVFMSGNMTVFFFNPRPAPSIISNFRLSRILSYRPCLMSFFLLQEVYHSSLSTFCYPPLLYPLIFLNVVLMLLRTWLWHHVFLQLDRTCLTVAFSLHLHLSVVSMFQLNSHGKVKLEIHTERLDLNRKDDLACFQA